MNTQALLDQLFKSGQDLLKQKSAGQGGSLTDSLGGLLKGAGGSGASLGGFLSGAGGGALAALLVSNKSARKLGSKAITYGGLAALGVIAYKAYSNWQSNQAAGTAPAAEPQTLDRLPAPQVELHSQAILRAMVAAAKADGHVDERERQLLGEQLKKLPADQGELQQWLHNEINQPLDPAAVARAASTPEMAAEMYIASVLMVDEEHFLERAYLDELARQLKLDPGLKVELESQVRRELGLA